MVFRAEYQRKERRVPDVPTVAQWILVPGLQTEAEIKTFIITEAVPATGGCASCVPSEHRDTQRATCLMHTEQKGAISRIIYYLK